MNNIILHVNNWPILGGIECTIIDLVRAFPQFYHIQLTLNDGEDYQYIAHLRQWARYINNPHLSKQLVADLKPSIIFLHNTPTRSRDQKHHFVEGEYPYRWLTQNAKIIGAHHGITRPLIPAHIDWFVSEYVRRAYRNLESRMNAFTMPPCVYPEPYLSIQRPARQVVVGRVQSSTGARSNKVSPEYYDCLKKLKDCTFFIVCVPGQQYERQDKRFVYKPIRPGFMPFYLKDIDIFTIWGNTTETWSRVATEANLSGIPVVARNHSDGLAEQLQKSGGGLLAETEQEFTEIIQMLIDNPKRRKEIGEQGRQWCNEHATIYTARKKFTPIFLDWRV